MTTTPRVATYHRFSTLDQNSRLARQELGQAASLLGELALAVEEVGSGARNDRPGWQRCSTPLVAGTSTPWWSGSSTAPAAARSTSSRTSSSSRRSYMDVDEDVVWKTSIEEIPRLIAALEPLATG